MKLIDIKLLSGRPAKINVAKISAMMVKSGEGEELPQDDRYSILVDGRWFAVENKAEYDRLDSLTKKILW